MMRLLLIAAFVFIASTHSALAQTARQMTQAKSHIVDVLESDGKCVKRKALMKRLIDEKQWPSASTIMLVLATSRLEKEGKLNIAKNQDGSVRFYSLPKNGRCT